MELKFEINMFFSIINFFVKVIFFWYQMVIFYMFKKNACLSKKMHVNLTRETKTCKNNFNAR
jgi:hypothetical protein